MKTVLCVLALVWPMAASGQTVFFDDFEGNALLPHWLQPPASRWEYNVSNSMLNVTGLFYPGIPHLGGNFAAMGALFTPQTDLRMEAWMGWEAGEAPHRLGLQVRAGPAGTGILATFRYANEAWLGPTPVIVAGAAGSPNLLLMPAPPPGIYHFAITRVGTTFEYYFNGSLFGSLAGNNIPATGIVLDFLGPYPGELGGFHIDRVKVIPAPGSLLIVLGLALGCRCLSRN